MTKSSIKIWLFIVVVYILVEKRDLFPFYFLNYLMENEACDFHVTKGMLLQKLRSRVEVKKGRGR